jgi:hypothetical protein
VFVGTTRACVPSPGSTEVATQLDSTGGYVFWWRVDIHAATRMRRDSPDDQGDSFSLITRRTLSVQEGLFNRSEIYLYGEKLSKDTLQDLSETFDMNRRERGIVATRRKKLSPSSLIPRVPNRRDHWHRRPSRWCDDFCTTPGPRKERGWPSVAMRWIQLPPNILVLPGLPTTCSFISR